MTTSFWADGPDRLREAQRSKRKELDRLQRELLRAATEKERRPIEARIRALFEKDDVPDVDPLRSLFSRDPGG